MMKIFLYKNKILEMYPQTLFAAFAFASLNIFFTSAEAAVKYIAVDVPGAVGTVPHSINDIGNVVGWSLDSNRVPHAFVRTIDENITTFDVPGAYNGTWAMDVDDSGEITGYYNSGNLHGFIRSPDGTIITFDTPKGLLTVPVAINRHGYVAGYDTEKVDGQNAFNFSFIRAPDGNVTTWGAPISNSNSYTTDINARLSVVGYYSDQSGSNHGFVRDSVGSIVTVDVPGSSSTKNLAINRAGFIAGNTSIPSNSLLGFIRDPGGVISTFDASGTGDFTVVSSLNNNGMVAGYYVKRSKGGVRTRGYLRHLDGQIQRFDALKNKSLSTVVYGLNNKHVVVGYSYTTDAGLGHGFIREP